MPYVAIQRDEAHTVSRGNSLVLRKMIVLNHRLNHPRVVDNVEGAGFLPFLPSKAHTCVPSYVW